MAKSFIVGGSQNATGTDWGDNETSNSSIINIASFATVDVAFGEQYIRDAGVFSNYYVFVKTNAIAVNTTFTVQKNRVDTTISILYSSTQTGVKEDTTHTSTFASGDEINISRVSADDPAGTTLINTTMFGIQFEPTTTTDCVAILGPKATLSPSLASTTSFQAVNGRGGNDAITTEANVKYRSRAAFTVSDLAVYVSANARTTDTIFKTRVNGADGSQSVTYTSGQTGLKEDSTNNDSLSVGDDFNYATVTSTGTGTLTARNLTTSFINTSNRFPLVTGRTGGGSFNFNTTTFLPIAGDLINSSATETNHRIYPRFDFTAKELGAYVTTNTIATSPTVLTLRDNGVDSAVTVSYNAAQTGLKEDTINTASITAGTDFINYKLVTPNTSGSITFTWIGLLGETASGYISRLSLLGVG